MKKSDNSDTLPETIRRDREIAMELLKPSKAQLEHGFELHATAPVVEAYCLGFHAPPDPDILQTLIDAGASRDELKDPIADMTVTGWARTPALQKEYQMVREAAGVTCIFQNAGEEGNHPLLLLKRLSCHSYLVDAMPHLLRRVFSVDDILSAKKEGKFATSFATNGVPLTFNHHSKEEEIRMIRVFSHLGVRMMHLTYNRRNPIGDGCGEPNDGGLSDFGHTVVAEMNRCGVMVDLAHAGWKTCLDAAKASSKPVVISHSGAAALNHHIRCKPDEVIAAAIERGGVMGITNVPAFLGGSGDLLAMLDHIDYVVRKFGADAVCIGTDQSYQSMAFSEKASKLKLPKSRAGWEGLWPPDDPLKDPKWNRPALHQSMSWTNWPLFTVGLVQRGHSDETIRKIIGGNLLRVAREVWEGSAFQPAGS